MAYLLPAAEPITLKVTPRFSVSRSQDVHLIVRIDPHAANRLLVLILDGPEYRRSDHQLEGAEAPTIFDEWFKSVRAPGQYVVQAVLVRAGGKQYVSEETFCLQDAEVQCTPSGSRTTHLGVEAERP